MRVPSPFVVSVSWFAARVTVCQLFQLFVSKATTGEESMERLPSDPGVTIKAASDDVSVSPLRTSLVVFTVIVDVG